MELAIKVYKTMPTTRLFVIDDADFVFGWFPLLAGNPGYPCCHLKSGAVDGPEKALAKAFLGQIEILEFISDEAK